MDVLLQRHKARYIYVIPEGLKELMSDISREVLRNQPENIYSFVADYLDALMITRENARVAAKTVENITTIAETIVSLLQKAGMSREEANTVSNAMQKSFQKYVSDKEAYKFTLSPEPFEERDVTVDVIEECALPEEQSKQAAIIIQKAFRLFKERQARAKDLLLGMVDWRVAARSTMRLYRKMDVTYEEANRAATMIKAAYKGYYTRRIMNRLLGKTKQIVEASEAKLAYKEETPSFWDQYEQETLEEDEKGTRDDELHVEFVEETKSIQPSEYASVSISTAESRTPNLGSVPSSVTVQSSEAESVNTEVIKAPIDVSSLTNTEESVNTDRNTEESEG